MAIRGPEFPHRDREVRKETVSVTLLALFTNRQSGKRSLVVSDGTMREFTDRKTGEIKRSEKVFLPMSQVLEIGGVDDLRDDEAIQAKVDQVVEVTAASWILTEKELI